MDGRAKDGQQAAKASDNRNKHMVQGKPMPTDTGTMGNAESKNYRALCVLRHEPELPKHSGVLSTGKNRMAEVA